MGAPMIILVEIFSGIWIGVEVDSVKVGIWFDERRRLYNQSDHLSMCP